MSLLLLGSGNAGGVAGGAPWTPSALSSALKAWYDFSLLTGSNGDPQGSVADSSGGGFGLTASGSLRPTLATSDLNSLNTVRFTAASVQRYALALTTMLSGASAASAYFVMKKVADPSAADASSALWKTGSDILSDHWPYTDGTIYDGSFSANRKVVGNPTVSLSSTYRIYDIHSAASHYSLFIDGGAGGSSGGTSAFYSTGTNTFGVSSSGFLGQNTEGDGFDGWLAELFITNANDSDKQKAQGYLAHKYALTGNLDSAHPYKSTPPTT